MSGYDHLASPVEPDPADDAGAPEARPLRVSSTGLRVPASERSQSRPAPAEATGPKRPRVALMGEFSAGKSTLSNLLIGASSLPVNVTATQLPPVWLSYGEDTPYRVDLNGEEFDIALDRLTDIKVGDTSHVRIFAQSKFLKLCDLIDMPGISDPNMAAEVWQRVIHNADIVVWCSHATQAWRQSEAAVWSTMPPALHDKSILLLTRMDRILSERDRQRVIRRVERETSGLFRKVLPVSLIRALEASDDAEAWAESGANALMETLVELVDEVANGAGTATKSERVRSRLAPGNVEDSIGEETRPEPARIVMPTRVRPRPLSARTNTD